MSNPLQQTIEALAKEKGIEPDVVISAIEEAVATATSIWQRINLVNLHENILPTRQRADLILKKGESHRVEDVALRKL